MGFRGTATTLLALGAALCGLTGSAPLVALEECDAHAGIAASERAAVDAWKARGRQPEDPALPLVAFQPARGRVDAWHGDPEVTAFTNVHVIPMDGDQVLRSRTVIVRGDRIETVGKASEAEIPAGATRIRGNGKYLMPGLTDMHVHTSYRAEHVFYVANGVTTIRDMWGSAGHVRFRDAVLAGEEFGATMYVASPGFVGPNPVLARAVVVTNANQARRQVKRHRRGGYDFIKIHERLDGAPYEAVAAKARGLGIPVTGHVAHATGIDRVLAGGAQTSISHLHRVIPGQGTDFWDQSPGSDAMSELARTFRTLGIANDPTLATLVYALDAAGVEAFLRRPELEYLPQWQIDSWVDWWNQFGPWRNPAGAPQALSNLQAMVSTLDREGAPLLLGTDGGFVFLLPGFAIHEELELYVGAGLSPYRALYAATVAAAEFLGAEDEFGRVAEGLRADLVLLNRNPLRNIRNTRRIKGVMLRGEWLPNKELKQRLGEVRASFE